MEQLRKYLIDVIALAVLTVLLIIALIPWAIREPSVARNQTSQIPQMTFPSEGGPSRRGEPIAIAAVFGFHPVVVVQDLGPQQEVANFINFLGYVVSENGKKKFFFKNTRSNEVLTLILGEQNGKGWKLVSVGDKFYTIVNGGNTYTVPK